MFNPVRHHCHLFTDFYKKFTCAEFKPFFIIRQIKKIHFFWKACLLVVPVGFDPRFNIIQGRYILTIPEKLTIIGSLFYFRLKKICRNVVKFKNNPKFHVNELCETTQYTIN